MQSLAPSPALSSLVRSRSLVAALPFDQTLYDARQGDRHAFSQLAERYLAAALRLAEQILRTEESAADAVQEALLKAYRAMHRFEDGNFRSWLLRIVANTCYDHLRRVKRHQTVSLDEMVEQDGYEYGEPSFTATDSPERTVIEAESVQAILNAINELPQWHSSVVMLVDVQGYNYAEAAKILKLPVGTVKSRLSRARIHLRNLLMQERLIVPV
ncbi:MAG: sigma-70 family RNA polymerase sigma factor [Caldilineaceae bacterium]